MYKVYLLSGNHRNSSLSAGAHPSAEVVPL